MKERPRLTAEEIKEIRRLATQGNAVWVIARTMGRSERAVRDALHCKSEKSVKRCETCGVLLQPGARCSYCTLDALDAVEYILEDDSDFWGPTLPPRERVVREGPPLCEVLLGG